MRDSNPMRQMRTITKRKETHIPVSLRICNNFLAGDSEHVSGQYAMFYPNVKKYCRSEHILTITER